jgi:hypothetical protein
MRAICGFAALGRPGPQTATSRGGQTCWPADAVAKPGRQWLQRPARTGGLPGYPGNQQPPGSRRTGSIPAPQDPRSRRTSDIPASRAPAASAARQDQRPPLGSVVPKPPETARHTGSPRVPCLEPTQSLRVSSPATAPARGPWPLPGWSRASADLAGQPRRTGDGPDPCLTGNQAQPVADHVYVQPPVMD